MITFAFMILEWVLGYAGWKGQHWNMGHWNYSLQYVFSVRAWSTRSFFISNAFFSTQHPCCLTILWIELQMLLRCCLIHITIIILRQNLQLVFSCPCLALGLFISYLCDLLFFFSLIFIVIKHIISLKQMQMFLGE